MSLSFLSFFFFGSETGIIIVVKIITHSSIPVCYHSQQFGLCHSLKWSILIFFFLFSILFLPITLEGRRGTTDFATIPVHPVLFPAALVELTGSFIQNSSQILNESSRASFYLAFKKKQNKTKRKIKFGYPLLFLLCRRLDCIRCTYHPRGTQVNDTLLKCIAYCYIYLHFASFVSFRLVTNLNPSKLRNRELCSP